MPGPGATLVTTRPPSHRPTPGSAGDAALAARLRELVARRCAVAPEELRDDLALADPALGLDSVALVELVLACERETGAQLPDLFGGGAATVGDLVRRCLEAAGRR